MEKDQNNTKETKKRLEAQVQGRVQGVGFRYSTLHQAQKLGVSGYVCNQADGSVKVVAEGPESALAKLLVWLSQGPSMSYVSEIKHHYQPYTGAFKRFTIEYDDF